MSIQKTNNKQASIFLSSIKEIITLITLEAHRGPSGRALDYVSKEREKFLARVRVSVWLKKFNTV